MICIMHRLLKVNEQMTSALNKKEIVAEKLIFLFEKRALDKILLEKRQIPISKEDLRRKILPELNNFLKYYSSIENELKPQATAAPEFLNIISTISAKIKLFFEYLKNESIDEETFDKSIMGLEPWYNVATYLVYFNNNLKKLILSIKDLGTKTKDPEAAKSSLSQLFDQAVIDKFTKDIQTALNETVTIYDFKFDDEEDEGVASMEANYSVVAADAGITSKADVISSDITKVPVGVLVNIVTKNFPTPKDISGKAPPAKEENKKVIENFLNKLKDNEKLRKEKFEKLTAAIKDELGVDITFSVTEKGGNDILDAAKKINDIPKSNPKATLPKMVEIINKIEK